MNLISRASLACALLPLAACNTLPTYVPASGEKTVDVSFVGFGRPSICVDGKSYKLDLTKKNQYQYVAQLPANKRVLVFSYQFYQGYQVMSSCRASLSLTPKFGMPVVINSGLDAGKCYVEAVLEDSSSPTGVALDPSVGPPQC
jgi:hypothetical protein